MKKKMLRMYVQIICRKQLGIESIMKHKNLCENKLIIISSPVIILKLLR